MIATVVMIGGLALLIGLLAGYLAGRAGTARTISVEVAAERARGESVAASERARAQAELLAERERAAAEIAALRAGSAAAIAEERSRAEQAVLRTVALRAEMDALGSTLDERSALLEETRSALTEQFQAMAAQALAGNNKVFLDLASATLETQREKAAADLDTRRTAMEQLVAPLTETLARMDESVRSVEKSRQESHGELRHQIAALGTAQQNLEAETRNLVSVLRAGGSRGRWGELQLRRIVELAGMLDHCDFVEQAPTERPGDRHRPDLVVALPGGAKVVVDSKAPMDSFLQAQDCADDALRVQFMKEHAKAVRQHVTSLSSKAYWEQFENTPDFVVMFLPGEALFATALEADPQLIEVAAGANVMLATPSSLITMLKTVAYGWRQERIAENADEVRRLGVELHERLRKLAEHFDNLRSGLQKATDSYNAAVGSFESRVLVSARKFEHLGAGKGRDLPELAPVEATLRAVSIREEDDPHPALPASVTQLSR